MAEYHDTKGEHLPLFNVQRHPQDDLHDQQVREQGHAARPAGNHEQIDDAEADPVLFQRVDQIPPIVHHGRGYLQGVPHYRYPGDLFCISGAHEERPGVVTDGLVAEAHDAVMHEDEQISSWEAVEVAVGDKVQEGDIRHIVRQSSWRLFWLDR